MDRMILRVVVVRNHPAILSSCLSREVSLLSWISVSGLSSDPNSANRPAGGNDSSTLAPAGFAAARGRTFSFRRGVEELEAGLKKGVQ